MLLYASRDLRAYVCPLSHEGLTLHISGPPRGNQSTITTRVSAAPLHVVVRHVESGRTVIAACLLRRYSRAVRSTAVPRAASGGWSVAYRRVRYGAGGLARRRIHVLMFVPHQSSSRLLIQLRYLVCAGLTPRISGAACSI